MVFPVALLFIVGGVALCVLLGLVALLRRRPWGLLWWVPPVALLGYGALFPAPPQTMLPDEQVMIWADAEGPRPLPRPEVSSIWMPEVTPDQMSPCLGAKHLLFCQFEPMAMLLAGGFDFIETGRDPVVRWEAFQQDVRCFDAPRIPEHWANSHFRREQGSAQPSCLRAEVVPEPQAETVLAAHQISGPPFDKPGLVGVRLTLEDRGGRLLDEMVQSNGAFYKLPQAYRRNAPGPLVDLFQPLDPVFFTKGIFAPGVFDNALFRVALVQGNAIRALTEVCDRGHVGALDDQSRALVAQLAEGASIPGLENTQMIRDTALGCFSETR